MFLTSIFLKIELEFDTYIPPPISEVLSSIRIASKVGEQLEITTPPPTGSEPPLNEIPRTVIFSSSGPSKEKQLPPRGPGPKNVSDMISLSSNSNALDSSTKVLPSKSIEPV